MAIFQQRLARTGVALLGATLSAALLSPAARAQTPAFIAAANRVDALPDAARNLVYITSGNTVLRYDLSANAFITPYTVDAGASLEGMDISPDGNTLLVADTTTEGANLRVWAINLVTSTIQKVSTPRANSFGTISENGTWAVAFGADGNALVTSRFPGSGNVPLHQYNAQTGTLSVISVPRAFSTQINQDSVPSASGDGSVIGIAENNSGNGPWDIFSVANQSFQTSNFSQGTSWENFEIGVNHDGTQFVLPTYGGTFIYDNKLNRLQKLGGSANGAIGVAMHPFLDRAYLPWAGTEQMYLFAPGASGWAQSGALDFSGVATTPFTFPGNHSFVQGRSRVSRDASLLTTTLTGGVGYVRLWKTLAANGGSIYTPTNTAVNVSLSGSISNNDPLGFQVIKQPTQGTLTGTVPNLTYTPSSGVNGVDSFQYVATYGPTKSAPATVSVLTSAAAPAPYVQPGQSFIFDQNTSTGFAILASDAANLPLTLSVVTPPVHGKASWVKTNIVYVAPTDYIGPDPFQVVASDGFATSKPETINAYVQTFAVAVNDVFTVSSGRSTTLDVLANDTVAPTAPEKVVDGIRQQPTHGTAAITADRKYATYTPVAGYTGTDSFVYNLYDGVAPVAGTVTVTVIAAPPVAVNDSATTKRNVAVNIAVLANDSDPNGQTLTVALGSAPHHGTAVRNANQTIQYTPSSNFIGTDVFTYSVTNTSGGKAIATVTVKVTRQTPQGSIGVE